MSRSEAGSTRRILTVIGNRPQFIKAAAVSPRLRSGCEEVLVHTGQHFDDALSSVFFSELGLPAPDRELGVSRGSNTSQVSRMLAGLEPLMQELAPDVVLVYGDTNSTLAGALAAAQAAIPVAHVEAGMRSHDPRMAEEINRRLTDHLSSLLLCPSELAVENLHREGLRAGVELVGDVMVDVAMATAPRVRLRDEIPRGYGLEPGEYLLVTAHRAANVDDPQRLRLLVGLLSTMPMPVLFAVHPRTQERLASAGMLADLARSVTLTGPLGYLELAALLSQARAVLTDSGGLQKEAYLARVPCLTLRSRTEWSETVQTGWNTLVDLDAEAARAALERPAPAEHPALYGDGRAGERVAQALSAQAELRPTLGRP